MGPLSYMRSVVGRNVVMRLIHVYFKTGSFEVDQAYTWATFKFLPVKNKEELAYTLCEAPREGTSLIPPQIHFRYRCPSDFLLAFHLQITPVRTHQWPWRRNKFAYCRLV